MARLSQLMAVARRLDAVFLALLLTIYVLAALLPAPQELVTPFPGVRTAQLVLALLLFVAGLRTAVPRDAGEVLSRGAAIGMGVVGRLAPLAAMLACLSLVSVESTPSLATDIAVGLTMVAAMPAANTSTAWTRRSSGDLMVCAGIVVATTMLAPLVIPGALAVVGDAGGPAEVSAGTFSDMAVGVVGWVVVPIVAGIVLGRLGGLGAGKPLGPAGSLGLLGALLLLNYINASQALPKVLERGGAWSLGWSACGAALLVPVCYAAGEVAGRLVSASPAQGRALSYAVGMSNTGLASTLVAAAFPGRPATLYPIVLCTLLQHVVAALMHERARTAGATAAVSRSAAEPEPPAASPAAPRDGSRR
jgi:BASS family bile acid:Na+ symporter